MRTRFRGDHRPPRARSSGAGGLGRVLPVRGVRPPGVAPAGSPAPWSRPGPVARSAARQGPGERDRARRRRAAGGRDRARLRLPDGQGEGRGEGAAGVPRTSSGSRRSVTRSAPRARSGWTPTAAGTSHRGADARGSLPPTRPGVRRAAVRHPGRARRARRLVDVPVAADESIRRAEDPLQVRAAGAADIVVSKAQPLGGVRSALEIAEQCGLPVVVSSAVDTSVGLAAGVALAAALPELPVRLRPGHHEPARRGRDRRTAGRGAWRTASPASRRRRGGAGQIRGGPGRLAGPDTGGRCVPATKLLTSTVVVNSTVLGKAPSP